jgi:Fur family ferric uptake transcriptional regulator
MGTRASYSTRPRELIAGVLEGARRFLTAADIHRALEEQDAKVSLSTVYRTLEYLLAKGDVTVRADEAGESSYMLCEPQHHHHHAICSVCGRVEDVDCSAFDQFAEELRAKHGFTLDNHQMEFIGRCRACR